jgi:hypothetical protein
VRNRVLHTRLSNALMGGKNYKPVNMWAFLDHWKGQFIAYIPESDKKIEEIVFVYFITREILPSTDEIQNEDGEFYEIIIEADAPHAMYLAAVVAGDAVVVPEIDDHHDSGVQRLILEYTGGGNPVVRFDG